jgi:putative endonuclease
LSFLKEGSIGQQAEDFALAWLQERGLVLIERNYRVQGGEIDLIMRDDAITVFIEVRYRNDSRHGSAEESITRSKQAKIIKTATWYYKEKRIRTTMRFDVIALSSGQGRFNLRWIKDAFRVN